MSGLQLTQVRVEFGGVRALAGVDLEVEPGERRALVGPNGAGKSTLFNAIGGQIAPSHGSVTLFGDDITRLSPPRRARRGLARTWQITNLFGSLSVQETVRLAVAANKPARRSFWRPMEAYDDIESEAEALLRKWEMWHLRGSTVGNLAYGQQRLLEIVVALASDPKVLLLDEPTAGLSSAEAHRMTRLTGDLTSDVTLVFIEHDMQVAFTLADTISVLVRGEVLATGTVDEIRHDPRVIEAYLGEATDDADG